MSDSPQDKRPTGVATYLEDALIVVSIGLLFVLTIFFRREAWGQRALLAVFVVMLIVLVRRLLRAQRAFKNQE